MNGWHEALASAFGGLRIALGAALLSIIVYRLYLNRPQRDVPITDAEILTYKRTGRHPGSGFSGYRIAYGGMRGWLCFWLMAMTALALAGCFLAEHERRVHVGHRKSWLILGLAAAAAGLYCAGLAWLLIREARIARHRRLDRLLAALALPPESAVLCLDPLLGLLGIAAARHGLRPTVLVPAAALAQTRINFRRAHALDRAVVETMVPGAVYAALLVTDRPDAATMRVALCHLAPGAPIATLGSRRPALPRLPPRLSDRLLAMLTLGQITPFARIGHGEGLRVRPT